MMTCPPSRFDQTSQAMRILKRVLWTLRLCWPEFKNELQPASQCVVFDGCPEEGFMNSKRAPLEWSHATPGPIPSFEHSHLPDFHVCSAAARRTCDMRHMRIARSSSEFGPYDYSRSGNPTRRGVLQRGVGMIEWLHCDRTALEKHVAMLEQVRFAVQDDLDSIYLMTPSKV